MPDILPTPKIYSSTIYNFLACTFLAYAKLMRLYQDIVINQAEKLVSIFQIKASYPGPSNGRSLKQRQQIFQTIPVALILPLLPGVRLGDCISYQSLLGNCSLLSTNVSPEGKSLWFLSGCTPICLVQR